MSNAEVYERVTNQVVAALEAGTVPWIKPWTGGVGLPMSMSSGKHYRGMNVFLLGMTAMARGYGCAWWGTYNQVAGLGGQIRKGEKSSLALLWKPAYRKDADGEQQQFLLVRGFNVFNADQADWEQGRPSRFDPPELGADHNPVDTAEVMIAGYTDGPAIRVVNSANAYYSPSEDLVNVPELNQFKSTEGYYSTIFHELTHSTGHKSRLNREGVAGMSRFGSHSYSKEELIAEMGAAMCCATAGIEPQIEQNAAYIAGWLRALQGDSKMVMQAAAQAQKAVDRILGVEVAADKEEVTG